MAAANWHFLIGRRAVDELKKRPDDYKGAHFIIGNPSVFLAGIQGPDLNFFPGGDGEVSDLAHGDKPADLGRTLLEIAETDEQKAYACGWLMHLTTDVVTHPQVNKMVVEKFPGKCGNGQDHKAYPLGHHRVEWGIDISLLRDSAIRVQLPKIDSVLPSARHLYPLVASAFSREFNFALKQTIWDKSIKGMVTYVGLFEKIWRLTGRLHNNGTAVQLIKDITFHTLVLPLMKLIALQNPENGAGVFIPVLPDEKENREIKERTELACRTFLAYMNEDFINLVNDTG